MLDLGCLRVCSRQDRKKEAAVVNMAAASGVGPALFGGDEGIELMC